MAEYVFTLRNVRKAHGDKVVLDNVTLSFLHGAKIGVVGPNGTGKSTLLKIMAGLEHANNGDAIKDPDATVGMLQQEPPLTEGKTVLENVEEAVDELKGKMARLDGALHVHGRPGRRPRQAQRRGRCAAERARRRQRVGPRQPPRAGDGRAALPAVRRPGRHPVRWRAPPGRALQAAAPAARPAAPRRAHQPPRRGVGAVAGGAPQELPGRRPGDHPRPVLPRQRRRVDPRARPRQDPPLRGQLLDVPRDEEGTAQDRGPEGRQALQDAGARARVGPLQRQGPADQEQVPAGSLRGDGSGGRPGPQDRHLRDQHPGRAATGRHRPRGQGADQGLRRPAADARPVVHAAPRGHRRRHRPQRRRQDHAVQDDQRRGEAGLR